MQQPNRLVAQELASVRSFNIYCINISFSRSTSTERFKIFLWCNKRLCFGFIVFKLGNPAADIFLMSLSDVYVRKIVRTARKNINRFSRQHPNLPYSYQNLSNKIAYQQTMHKTHNFTCKHFFILQNVCYNCCSLSCNS